MKELPNEDLQPAEKSSLLQRLAFWRKPRKTAPAPEAVRGWAKSAVRNRHKS